MSIDWPKTIADIDAKLKAARYREALSLFRAIEAVKWPREQTVPLGHLARRLGLPYVILKRLNPIVQSSAPLKKPASPQEVALYCIGLTRIGAFAEAEQRLKALSALKSTDVQFALGSLYIWTWEYKKALRPFRRYLAAKTLDDYARLVGRVNLLACMMTCGPTPEAFAYGNELLRELPPGQTSLLRANTLEIFAQGLQRQERFLEAEACLREAHDILRDSGSDFEILAKKWSLIIEMRSKKHVDESRWRALRQTCQSRGNFEIVRELDFNRAVALNDPHLFNSVYRGTSFPSYKRRLKKLKESVTPLPRSVPVLWNPHMEENACHQPIQTVQLRRLPLSPAPHRLLRALLTDFYRPLQLGEAFRGLYPKEYFNPYSSPARLYAIFLRLKAEVLKHRLPFNIHWTKRQIRILPTAPIYLDLSSRADRPNKKGADHLWAQMRKQRSFSVEEVSREQGVSRRSVERRVASGMRQRLIRKMKPGSYAWI